MRPDTGEEKGLVEAKECSAEFQDTELGQRVIETGLQ